ncbi:peptidase S41 [Idiomarina tyrosinivorans]|uniref:Peptidase S41 n=1 Tax=Idiomarina tyrosinivorans TaxID=1445662 RepID=A0A432ZRG7_9GAMM|nr:S41 family peptidase [Idiomarina tyrosinivorans]RUO80489.1 peptidase S41 [Idiomarina tyrosinivorans]
MFRYGLMLMPLLTLAGCGSDSSGTDSNASVEVCSVADQKQRFFEHMKQDYYWADQLPQQLDLSQYQSMAEVLEALRVPQDRYSYILTEDEYQSLFIDASYYGFGFSALQTNDNRVLIRYNYPSSPAAEAGLARGDELLKIEGEAVATLLAERRYQDALGPNQEGISRELTWQKPDGSQITAELTKTQVEQKSVFATQTYQLADNSRVGYFVIDSFIGRTGDDLNQAYNQLAQQNIDHLVIDVRYNGGGYIQYANQASTQAAGNNVLGKVFAEFRFNDNNASKNSTLDFDLGEGIEQLNIDTVYVLTTRATCSASELIINSLKPHVNVINIGSQSCGKPVGQEPTKICDKRTFEINFALFNSAGQGNYFTGLTPTCNVADQIVADWGSNQDPLTAAANYYMENNQCPASAAVDAIEQQSQQRQPQPLNNLREKRKTVF